MSATSDESQAPFYRPRIFHVFGSAPLVGPSNPGYALSERTSQIMKFEIAVLYR